ncbi:glycosyltransferase family 61 protein [Gloeocapsa sp. BRSZ]
MLIFQPKDIKRKIVGDRFRALPGMVNYPLRQWMFSFATTNLGLQTISKEKIIEKSSKYNVIRFGVGETIVAREPVEGSDILPKLMTNHIGKFTLQKPFISEFTEATLVGSTAVGFNKSGHVISETVSPNRLSKTLPINTILSRKLIRHEIPQIDTASSLVNIYNRNYFHWLVDCLLRLEGIEYYHAQTGRKPLLIIDSNPPAWKIESLKLLGYKSEDYIYWNGVGMKVERLVVSSFRREKSFISPVACRWLRQRVLSNLPKSQDKKSYSSRIYISRPKSAGRQVINEEEVLKALTPLGFVSYTLENMSFTDQVALFSQAEIVVAAHGAGLTNIVFAQKLIVIELFGSMVAPFYFLLTQALGFQYGCLLSEPEINNQYSEKFKGLVVKIDKLQHLVVQMMKEHSSK